MNTRPSDQCDRTNARLMADLLRQQGEFNKRTNTWTIKLRGEGTLNLIFYLLMQHSQHPQQQETTDNGM